MTRLIARWLRGDSMRVEPAYADALRACGLDHVAGVLARIDGDVAAWSRTTDTLRVSGDGNGPGFYLKRYHYPRWRNRLRGALRGTFFGLHRGQREQRLLSTMRSLGIPAVRPVACGARRIAHFVRSCFLITEEVPGACNLTSLAQQVDAGQRVLPPGQRRRLVHALAQQVAHMHRQGFPHGQLFWRNILVRFAPHGEPEFFFLDARPRRTRSRLTRGSGWRVDELAQLLVSAEPFSTPRERLRFLIVYTRAAGGAANPRIQARQALARAPRWRAHELQRIRMNARFDAWSRQLELELAQLRCPPGTPTPVSEVRP